MIIKNEVDIHEKGKEYIEETLSQYKEVSTVDTVENPIIHIYPKQDTYDENGELTGFIDALFSEFHIYDTKNKTVYKSKHYHDGLMPFTDLKVLHIKVFKDMSFMVVLRGKYQISFGTALSIGLVN